MCLCVFSVHESVYMCSRYVYYYLRVVRLCMRECVYSCVFVLCSPAARTRDVMRDFGETYQQQYAVALFNSVRYEIEGGGSQSQLLHRKASPPTPPPCFCSFCIRPSVSQEEPGEVQDLFLQGGPGQDSGANRLTWRKNGFTYKTIPHDDTHKIHKSKNTT